MAGKSATKSADYVHIKEGVLCNLNLLSFGKSTVAVKNHIILHTDSFEQLNKKAYECVMHFLFSKLEPSHQKFRDCWPIVERKDEVAFRNICTNWLSVLALEEELPRNPGPILFSPFGRKFYNLLLDFSSMVLSKNIKDLGGMWLLDTNAPTWLLCSATERHKKRYEDHSRRFMLLEKTWLTVGSKMIRGVSNLLDNISSLSNRTNEMPCLTSYEEAKDSEIWTNLNADVARGNDAVKSTSHFLSEGYAVSVVDGKKLQVQVPQLLRNAFQSTHNVTVFRELNDSGRVDLFALMDLFKFAVQCLLENQQGSVNMIEEHQRVVGRVLSQHTAIRHSSQTLSSKLSTTLKEVEASTNTVYDVAINHHE